MAEKITVPLSGGIGGLGEYMGLDGVEMVLAIEEEFKIAIADSDAEQGATGGKVVDLVYSRLRHNSQEPCPSQHGFYIVRRRLMNLLDIQRSQIRPETELKDLIGRKNRRKVWRDLIQSLTNQKTNWPVLVRPMWMTIIIIFLIPVVTYSYVFVFTQLSWAPPLLALVFAAILGGLLTMPFKQEFPVGFRKVQDLIKLVKTLDSSIWSKEEVFNKIKTITVNILGVKESEVTLDARFVEDLGLS